MEESKPNSLDINKIQKYSQKFVRARDWDQYHSPKNIAIGLAIEAAELMEIFQWLTDKQSFEIQNNPEKIEQVSDEIGDIFHYLIRISTLLKIDLNQAFWNKMKKTEEKYPVALAKGKTEKYSELVSG